MRLLALQVPVFLLIGSLAAAPNTDVSGKWAAQTLMGPSGSEQAIPTTFTFNVDGDKLTGNVSSPRGESEILDGKVDGDSVIFTIVVTDSGSSFKLMYDGRITAEGIDFIAKIEGRDRSDHFIAKRVPG